MINIPQIVALEGTTMLYWKKLNALLWKKSLKKNPAPYLWNNEKSQSVCPYHSAQGTHTAR